MGHCTGHGNVLRLKLDSRIVEVFYRTPAHDELIDALVKKMPRGNENEDAGRALVANLELGRSCITGFADGEQKLGRASSEEDDNSWQECLAQSAPLVLIALGQYLSRIPEFLEGDGKKKL
jgi:hypothetical protein